jgi:hypothetical protein
MTPKNCTIWCCGCNADVAARLTDGQEVYPHCLDLASLPFWRCDACGRFVGCHYKTQDRTRPLGVIPTLAMRHARQHIHSILDPIWKDGRMSRKQIYARLTETLGRQYHTADLRTMDEARMIYREVARLSTGNV